MKRVTNHPDIKIDQINLGEASNAEIKVISDKNIDSQRLLVFDRVAVG
jgi:hypothetical protein